MWTSMRVLRVFTVADLVTTAEVTQRAAREYVRLLVAAGYLMRLGRVAGSRGCIGAWMEYRLVRNTGPHHPILSSNPVKTSLRGRWRHGQ
jgi:hypothetical protein